MATVLREPLPIGLVDGVQVLVHYAYETLPSANNLMTPLTEQAIANWVNEARRLGKTNDRASVDKAFATRSAIMTMDPVLPDASINSQKRPVEDIDKWPLDIQGVNAHRLVFEACKRVNQLAAVENAPPVFYPTAEWNGHVDESKLAMRTSPLPFGAPNPFREQTQLTMLVNAENNAAVTDTWHEAGQPLHRFYNDEFFATNATRHPYWRNSVTSLLAKKFPSKLASFLQATQITNGPVIRKHFFVQVIGYASKADLENDSMDASLSASVQRQLSDPASARVYGWHVTQFEGIPSAFQRNAASARPFPLQVHGFFNIGPPTAAPGVAFLFNTGEALSWVQTTPTYATRALAINDMNKCALMTRLPMTYWTETAILSPANIDTVSPMVKIDEYIHRGTYGQAFRIPWYFAVRNLLDKPDIPSAQLQALVYTLTDTRACIGACMTVIDRTPILNTVLLAEMVPFLTLRTMIIQFKTDRGVVAELSTAPIDAQSDAVSLYRLWLMFGECLAFIENKYRPGVGAEDNASLMEQYDMLVSNLLQRYSECFRPVTPQSQLATDGWMSLVRKLVAKSGALPDLAFIGSVSAVAKLGDIVPFALREALVSLYLSTQSYQPSLARDYYGAKRTNALDAASGAIVPVARNDMGNFDYFPSVVLPQADMVYVCYAMPDNSLRIAIPVKEGDANPVRRNILALIRIRRPPIADANVYDRVVTVPASVSNAILPCFGILFCRSYELTMSPLLQLGNMDAVLNRSFAVFYANIAPFIAKADKKDVALFKALIKIPSQPSTSPLRNISVPKLVRMYRTVVSSMHYMNHQGLSHGDLKPENVFVDALGNAIIGDLGGALPYGSADYQLSTPSYAPDAYANKQAPYSTDSILDTVAAGYTIKYSLENAQHTDRWGRNSRVWSFLGTHGACVTARGAQSLATELQMTDEQVRRLVHVTKNVDVSQVPISGAMTSWVFSALNDICTYLIAKPVGADAAEMAAQLKTFDRRLLRTPAELRAKKSFAYDKAFLSTPEFAKEYGYYDRLKMADCALEYVATCIEWDQAQSMNRM